MTQYIDKNKVEEILRNLWKKDDGRNSEHRICYNKALQEVQCELDTIEVKEVDLEDAIDDAKNLAMRDMAWNVHVMISEGKSISEIDHYVCGICDF